MKTSGKGYNTVSLQKAVWATIGADSPTLVKIIKEGKRVSTTLFMSELSSASYKTLTDLLLVDANWTEDNLTFLPDESEEHMIIATKVASAHMLDTYNVYFHVDK